MTRTSPLPVDRFDWSAQNVLLRRLCSDSPNAVRLIDLAEKGLADEDIVASLTIQQDAFDQLVDEIHRRFCPLVVAFWRLRRMAKTVRNATEREREELETRFANELDALRVVLRPAAPLTRREQLVELSNRSFVDLLGQLEGDLPQALNTLSQLAAAKS